MKVRNKIETSYYIDCVKTAIDSAKQAIDSITYTSYPELNQRTIAKLKESIHFLESACEAPIYKP